MFNQKNRLRKKKEIEKVFKSGKGFYSDILGFKFLKNDLNESRFCIIISAKISKKAVIRNKIRRRIRAIIIEDLKKIKKDTDLIIIVNKNISDFDFLELKKSISFVFKKFDLYV